jgi:hypothetical protein
MIACAQPNPFRKQAAASAFSLMTPLPSIFRLVRSDRAFPKSLKQNNPRLLQEEGKGSLMLRGLHNTDRRLRQMQIRIFPERMHDPAP